MDNKSLFSPKFPTFPIQDQFTGKSVMHFGSSRIEDYTIQIASSMMANPNIYTDSMLPETIADEAYNIAVACMEKVHDEFLKASATPAEPIVKKLDGQWPESKL